MYFTTMKLFFCFGFFLYVLSRGVSSRRLSREAHFDPADLKKVINFGQIYFTVCALNSVPDCRGPSVDDEESEAEVEKVDKLENRKKFDWIVQMYDLCKLANKMLAFEELGAFQRQMVKQLVQNSENASTLMYAFYNMPKFCGGSKYSSARPPPDKTNGLKLCDWTRVFCSRLEGEFMPKNAIRLSFQLEL